MAFVDGTRDEWFNDPPSSSLLGAAAEGGLSAMDTGDLSFDSSIFTDLDGKWNSLTHFRWRLF